MATSTIETLHPDLIVALLRRMDGPTLAAFSSSSSLLRHLSSDDPSLWKTLSLATWPSLRHPRLLHSLDHRRFFSDSFPFPFPFPADASTLLTHKLPGSLISAVDLFHHDTPVFSRVIDTKASSAWFLDSPFRVDALDRKDPERTDPATNPAELTLSWVVLDPESRRAVNVSSRRPVAIDRQWYTGETLVRFAVVLGGCAVAVVVTCGEEDGHVREVSLTVEDVDGRSVSGRESLVVLKGAMEGERRGTKWGEMVVKGKYDEFLRERQERRDTRVWREGLLDLCCTGFGALMFLSFMMMLAFR